MAIYSKGSILLATVLAVAYSYRLHDDYYESRFDGRRDNLDTFRQDMYEEKRATDECKYPGALCNNVYSYGCHKYVKKCDGKGCITEVSDM